MFERRLKIFLSLIVLTTVALLLRAAQVQIVDHKYWSSAATQSSERHDYVETLRGDILDFKDHKLALDEPCTDAAVDYRAIAGDEKWIREQAQARLIKRLGGNWRSAQKAEREALVTAEAVVVQKDIAEMWDVLATFSGKPFDQARDEIEQARAAIMKRVMFRQTARWQRKYDAVMGQAGKRDEAPWYKRLLLGEEKSPAREDIEVAEQKEAHVILRAIDDRIQFQLGKVMAKCPGLVLQRSTHRIYPYGAVACHVLGHLSTVRREDMLNDPDVGDGRRRYDFNDLIGRSGIEALCEPALRGLRGEIVRGAAKDEITSTVDAQPGKNVKITIDIDLQQAIMEALAKPRDEFDGQTHALLTTRKELHGAVVVIDVATGQVRAMVSNPGFDLNQFDRLYAHMSRDDLNNPLINRATQAQLEPGSTAKPVIALGALTDKTLLLTDDVECNGYLVINGNRFGNSFRCWTAKSFSHIAGFAHHQIPDAAPHNPPPPRQKGFLDVVDALERSCNVFFETVAFRMGLERISHWLTAFGVGRLTGIGLDESTGRVPHLEHVPTASVLDVTFNAGIGQGEVLATPLQMANVAATIARNGIWIRPRIVVNDDDARLPANVMSIPNRIDLQLDPAGLKAVQEGMIHVVNAGGGTGKMAHRDDMLVAGKTGTAQVGKLAVPERDEAGNILKINGRTVWKPVEPNTYPWYQGTGSDRQVTANGWFIGFAPANKPQIAIAVLSEYSGSGGVATQIAADVLEACVQHGYLSPQK